jgi:hypothetical protein
MAPIQPQQSLREFFDAFVLKRLDELTEDAELNKLIDPCENLVRDEGGGAGDASPVSFIRTTGGPGREVDVAKELTAWRTWPSARPRRSGSRWRRFFARSTGPT